MAGEFVIFVVIIIIILWFVNPSQEGVLDEIKAFLELRGYKVNIDSVSENKKINAMNDRLSISLTLTETTTDFGNNYLEIYRIEMKTKVRDPIRFNITKPRGPQRAINSLNPNITAIGELNIETSNPFQIQKMFAELGFREHVEDVFRKCLKLEVTPQIGKNFITITIDLSRNSEYAIKAIKLAGRIVTIMNSGAIQSYILGVNEKYICFKCNEKIPFEGDVCTNCGAIAPKCIICFEDPEPNEEVLLFACCKSYSHKEHAEIWLRDNSKCPLCLSRDPPLIRVEDTKKM